VPATTIGIAISIPEPWRACLDAARFRAGDPAAGTIPAHVTLLGPSELTESAFAATPAHLTRVASRHRPFTLRLNGTGTFRPVTEVVFVAVTRGADVCERLAADIRSGPLDRELSYPYHPHVTVAQDVPTDRLDRVAAELAAFVADIEVDRFNLYELRTDGTWFSATNFVLGSRRDG
jgi:2'-5' RNA ligase